MATYGRNQRRRRKMMMNRIIVIALLVVSVILIAVCIKLLVDGSKKPGDPTGGAETTTVADSTITETTTAAAAGAEVNSIISEADLLMAGYDPDAAIAKIKEYANYLNEPKLVEKIASYETEKATYQAVDVTKVTHVFYHTLIADTGVCFALTNDNYMQYDDAMTTMGEFQKIMESMYERGYVLVDIHDLGHIEVQADGTEKMVRGTIMLPPGKKAFVLSQDDVCYYEYMTGDGFASKLVIDENNNVVNEYTKADGTTVYGSYDVVPMTEDFIREHPDFSYQGARGILGVTGYNGILGYRTSEIVYGPNGQEPQLGIDVASERAKAEKVATRLKEMGWSFASHSWGHLHLYDISDESYTSDLNKWETEVEPLVGETDVILYPFGQDPSGSWRPYPSDNVRINQLKEAGFRYFCTVDSSETWVQFSDNVFKQGRRNLDGYRMWEALQAENGVADAKNRVSDLFDVKEVFDTIRPTPIIHD